VNKSGVITCAVIGLGRIGSTLEDDSKREKPASHAGAVIHNPATILVAGCDKEEQKRINFGNRWNIKTVYEDAETMIRLHSPDILHIATLPATHIEYMELALRYNVPVIICEKPVSDRLPEVMLFAEFQNRRTSRIIINHERRYARDYRKVRELIKNETYGELRAINAKVHMGQKRKLTNILLDDGTHMLDIIPFLTGEPLTDISISPKLCHNLNIFGRCGDIPVLCEIGNGRDHLVFELDLSFERGRIQIGNGLYKEWQSGPSPLYDNFNSLLPVECENMNLTGYFSGMMEDAVNLVRNSETKPVSGLEDGIASLKIIDTIRKQLE